MSNVSPVVLGALGIGGIFVYSGLKGKSFSSTFRSLITSGSIANGTTTNAISTTASASAVSATAGSVPDSYVSGSSTVTAGGSAATNQNIARLLAAPYGWSTGQNWTDLVALWNKESSWSNTADNPSSHAYGIAQALPATKYPLAGQPPPKGISSATAQIAWGLQYIKSRYGSPSAAWAHETAMNWY